MNPLFLGRRSQSINYFKFHVPVDVWDDFIKAKEAEGLTYTYRDIMVASLIRIFKTRPQLNRFIVGGRLYQRKHIDFAMMVHKSLRTGAEEAALKVRYTGYETIGEIKQKLDAEIHKAVHEKNGYDGFDRFFRRAPLCVLKFFVGALRFFDRFGMLSAKTLFQVSPFHSSIYFADMKSIKMPYIYHHLYRFGNCGFFLSMGMPKMEAVVNDDGQVVPRKMIQMGVAVDDRVLDGLYFSRSIKGFMRWCSDPSILENPLEEHEIYHELTPKEKRKKAKIKASQKEAKGVISS